MKTKGALLWELNAPFKIDEIDVDDEVQIRVRAAGLCHSAAPPIDVVPWHHQHLVVSHLCCRVQHRPPRLGHDRKVSA